MGKGGSIFNRRSIQFISRLNNSYTRLNIVYLSITKWTIDWIAIICPTNNWRVISIKCFKVLTKICWVSKDSMYQWILFFILIEIGEDLSILTSWMISKSFSIIYMKTSNSSVKLSTKSSGSYINWSCIWTVTNTTINNHNIGDAIIN